MPALNNPKHEAFATQYFFGASGTQAYRECVAGKNTKTSTCMSQATVMLADPKIAQRVKELKRSFREMLAEKFGIRAETIARILVEVIETPIGELDENHPLTEVFRRNKYGTTIRGMSKMGAIHMLCKMAGFYEAEKTCVEVPSLAELLDRLVNRGIPRMPKNPA